MAGTGFKRVSKKSPCRACGKPDWCSTTATELISFCARSALGADRISRFGWGVYYSSGSRPATDLGFTQHSTRFPARKKTTISKHLAPPEIRNRVYRKLIELAPASSNFEIVNGRGGLAERRIQNFSLYGNLPRLATDRRVLVEQLTEALAKEGIRTFEGIPGFWRDSKNRPRLWSERDSFDSLMIIPFVGPDRFIRACQIRFMKQIPNKSGRYVWLSSLKEKAGCGPGAPLHHADAGLLLDRPVLVTEGALKAAAAQRFFANKYVVGNSGVSTSHREIIETARQRPLEIAFDNDSITNPHVARSLAALLRLRLVDQESFGYTYDVRILSWDLRMKGLDDALHAGLEVSQLTVSEWLKELSPACREQANRQLLV